MSEMVWSPVGARVDANENSWIIQAYMQLLMVMNNFKNDVKNTFSWFTNNESNPHRRK
jgi:hypothetical protein